jgi:hypothetical protein
MAKERVAEAKQARSSASTIECSGAWHIFQRRGTKIRVGSKEKGVTDCIALLALCLYQDAMRLTNAGERTFFPSIATMAAAYGTGKDRVRSALALLDDECLLSLKVKGGRYGPRRTADGRQRRKGERFACDEYVVIPHKLWAEAHPGKCHGTIAHPQWPVLDKASTTPVPNKASTTPVLDKASTQSVTVESKTRKVKSERTANTAGEHRHTDPSEDRENIGQIRPLDWVPLAEMRQAFLEETGETTYFHRALMPRIRKAVREFGPGQVVAATRAMAQGLWRERGWSFGRVCWGGCGTPAIYAVLETHRRYPARFAAKHPELLALLPKPAEERPSADAVRTAQELTERERNESEASRQSHQPTMALATSAVM